MSPGFEGMKQQEVCNKIVAKLLEDYSKFFECEQTENDGLCEDMARIITVKVNKTSVLFLNQCTFFFLMLIFEGFIQEC